MERLEEKNRYLEAKIKSIKEVVAWLKSSMRDGSRKRESDKVILGILVVL